MLEGSIVDYFTAQSNLDSSTAAARHLIEQLLAHSAAAPTLLMLYFSERYEADLLRRALRQAFPDTPLVGCSSCQAVRTALPGEVPVALAAIYDPQGAYGVAGGSSGEGDVRRWLRQAMAACGRPGELPQMVLLHTTPGGEEALLAELDEELGGAVPVIGGSAGDDTLSGQWRLCWQQQTLTEGSVLAVFYPDCELVFQFHAGYRPTGHSAIVTRAEGREVINLDERPAAEVYGEWVGQVWPIGPVLHETTFFPLARHAGEMYGMPCFKLSHPESVTARHGVRLFTDIHEGERLVLMQGSETGVLERSLLAARIEPAYGMPEKLHPIGALIIFCAGYRYALAGRVDEIIGHYNERLGGVPYLIPFTFGEQGRMPQGELVHGNLMISSVIFCRGA